MAEVALDANVIVGFVDAADSQHKRALELVDRLEQDGHSLVLLDVTVFEALSVVCRRAAERRSPGGPDLGSIIAIFRRWMTQGEVRWVAMEAERLVDEILDLIESTSGALNFNDALLVALERDGVIEHLASFDSDFDLVEGFQRIS